MNGSTPGSETPKQIERRKFLARACGILAAPLAVVIGFPLFGSLVGTIYRKSKLLFSKTPGFSSASQGQPIKLNLPAVKMDAYLRTETSQDLWVVKHTPTEATVFSPICPPQGSQAAGDSAMCYCACNSRHRGLRTEVTALPTRR